MGEYSLEIDNLTTTPSKITALIKIELYKNDSLYYQFYSKVLI